MFPASAGVCRLLAASKQFYSDSEREAGFRIRYSVACLLPSTLYLRDLCYSWSVNQRLVDHFCDGQSFEKLSGGNWMVKLTL